ncbi:50S ribosomal protein L11 methyltransferase [Allomuricauda sp. d1]|uniref:50S ribosomal protein L11 methyltransferase n=1 Tax=Allomuricauda sp. d1 TaxID=3136725 RepID=UPI0031E2ED40
MNYLEFNFRIAPVQPAGEILIAELSQLGFESFVEQEGGVLTYIKSEDFVGFDSVHILKNPDVEITWSSKEIVQQNWNAEWERNFKPIRVGDECMVRAPFHPKENVKYDIVIEPKMSFGTGHHETTYMMLQHVLKNDFSDKTVLDMGCGTGVLAILAEKRGAKVIDAIDIDPWCYENTQENISRNGCEHILVFQGDSSLLTNRQYDVVLANINKNILIQDIPIYAKILSGDGLLFLSGFYKSDIEAINEKCASVGLNFTKSYEENDWVASVHRFY